MLLIARIVSAGAGLVALLGAWQPTGSVPAHRLAPGAPANPQQAPTPVVHAPGHEPVLVLAASTASTTLALEELARRDPLAVARLGRDRYDSTIHDYRCLFVKQERLKGKLRDEEQIEVRFRRAPHSVYMFWKKNADQAKRVLFIDLPEYVNDEGVKTARVEPAGVIARAFVSEVTRPIHGDEAKEASRRTIDEFGFRALIGLLERFNGQAQSEGVLDYRFIGDGVIDDRPTLIFERHLPYTGEDSKYPDAKLVLHLDREWLLPVAVYSYADRAGKELLGSYIFKNVELNPGMTDADFRF